MKEQLKIDSITSVVEQYTAMCDIITVSDKYTKLAEDARIELDAIKAWKVNHEINREKIS